MERGSSTIPVQQRALAGSGVNIVLDQAVTVSETFTLRNE